MITYCTECPHFEKRTIRAEVPMDSGHYIDSGTYYRCNKFRKCWSNISGKEVDLLYCKEAHLEIAP